jgi:hypothetical protein
MRRVTEDIFSNNSWPLDQQYRVASPPRITFYIRLWWPLLGCGSDSVLWVVLVIRHTCMSSPPSKPPCFIYYFLLGCDKSDSILFLVTSPGEHCIRFLFLFYLTKVGMGIRHCWHRTTSKLIYICFWIKVKCGLYVWIFFIMLHIFG